MALSNRLRSAGVRVETPASNRASSRVRSSSLLSNNAK
jgi:hypothetical protein